MHTPYIELTVIFLVVLRVAIPICVLLTIDLILERRERRQEGTAS